MTSGAVAAAAAAAAVASKSAASKTNLPAMYQRPPGGLAPGGLMPPCGGSNTGPLESTPMTQPAQIPGPVSGSATTKGIVLLQISRDAVYDPRKIDFASLSLPNKLNSIKQK